MSRGFKSEISPAACIGHRVASHCLIGAIAERPAHTASTIACGSRPAAQTAPVPVMTTLRWFIRNAGIRSGAEADAVDGVGPPQSDATVRSPETERVGQCKADAALLRRVEHER